MKNKIIILLTLVAFLASCTDKFEEFNTDIKNPAIVTGEALFTHAQIALVDQVSSTDVNLNVWKLFAQYWTETTYVDEANYDIVNRTIPDNTFQEYYVGNDATNSGGFLKNLQEATDIITRTATTCAIGETEKANKLAIIELLNVYSYQNLVDIFGNVPYSEALKIDNIDPIYDDAFTIYQDLIARVDEALGTLDPTAGSFGSADLIYGGDVAAWIRFANSLKLKLGITLSDSHPALSKTTVEGAVTGGVFASNDDNAMLHYMTAIHVNPIYEDLVQSGRDDFVPANTIVTLMNTLADPRRPLYFTTVGGVYSGGVYGASSPYSQYSHVSDAIVQPDFPGVLLSYDEVLFYLAEAAARGYVVGGTPDVFYNQAVTASTLRWGGTDAMATAYLAQPNVAYATAAGTWQQKIGTQSYIAFYTRGLEGYTQWRRLDYPILNIPPSIATYAEIPKRFTYPVNEQTLNKANYDQAASAIGGDNLTTKIFWDKF
jgi:hypothetical protein